MFVLISKCVQKRLCYCQYWLLDDEALCRVALNIYEMVQHERIEECGPPYWSAVLLIFSNGLLPVLNSTFNFFIYFFAGHKFRAALLALVTCRSKMKM